MAGVAHRGLAITYQRWAHEQITDENYCFAEDLLEKAAAHGKEAATHDLLDPLTLSQLGYTSKDLAIRFQRTNRPAQAERHLDEALRYFTSVLKMNAEDASAHNGVASVSLIRGDYDRAIAEAEAAIALHPDYREAQFDLAQAYYTKIRAHPDDINLLLRGLDVTRSMMQSEQDAPQLPQHALQQLMVLYEPLIARANALFSRSATPATAPEPAPSASDRSVGTFTFAGAATTPHVDELSAALEAYVEYLHALGQSPDEPRPVIFIDPDESPEHARAAYADRKDRRLVVGLALVEQRDTVLHEYTHYALEGAASTGRESWPAGVRALEAGIAYYLPCSYGDDPRHVGLYDLRVTRRPPPPWLDQAHRDGLASATAMWQLRTDVGAEVLDRLLLDTWRASAILPTGPSEATFVERLDHALLDNHPSRTLNDLLREHCAMLESG